MPPYAACLCAPGELFVGLDSYSLAAVRLPPVPGLLLQTVLQVSGRPLREAVGQPVLHHGSTALVRLRTIVSCWRWGSRQCGHGR